MEGININFFQKNGKFDTDAIGMGIYIIELGKKDSNNKIPLYIGESVWMIVRCAGHLHRVYKKPEYLGLEADDIKNNNLELVIRVLEPVDEKNKLMMIETDYIEKIKPLTQKREEDKGRGKRDSMIQMEEKIKRVQDEIKRLLNY